MTEQELLNLLDLAKQGPWALLFVWLLWTTKKEAKDREEKLLAVLDRFSEKYDLIIEKLDGLENLAKKLDQQQNNKNKEVV